MNKIILLSLLFFFFRKIRSMEKLFISIEYTSLYVNSAKQEAGTIGEIVHHTHQSDALVFSNFKNFRKSSFNYFELWKNSYVHVEPNVSVNNLVANDTYVLRSYDKLL